MKQLLIYLLVLLSMTSNVYSFTMVPTDDHVVFFIDKKNEIKIGKGYFEIGENGYSRYSKTFIFENIRIQSFETVPCTNTAGEKQSCYCYIIQEAGSNMFKLYVNTLTINQAQAYYIAHRGTGLE